MSREDFDGGYSEWAKEQHKIELQTTQTEYSMQLNNLKSIILSMF